MPVAYRGGVWGVQNPPPRNSEGPPKNHAKLNPTVKTVKKKLLNLGCQHTKMFGKKAVKLKNYVGSQLFYISNDK